MVEGTLQSNDFLPLKSPSEDSKVHQDSNSQNESSLGNVRVHSLTLSYNPGSMKCDSHASFFTRTFASLCLRHKPKVRFATIMDEKINWNTI
jgi:hypothetical protein